MSYPEKRPLWYLIRYLCNINGFTPLHHRHLAKWSSSIVHYTGRIHTVNNRYVSVWCSGCCQNYCFSTMLNLIEVNHSIVSIVATSKAAERVHQPPRGAHVLEVDVSSPPTSFEWVSMSCSWCGWRAPGRSRRAHGRTHLTFNIRLELGDNFPCASRSNSRILFHLIAEWQ